MSVFSDTANYVAYADISTGFWTELLREFRPL